VEAEGDDRLVSCLMVTLPVPGRLEHLKRSIADYCWQTHAKRELVIVMDAGIAACRLAIRSFVLSLGRHDIRVVDPSGGLSLGALRNISVGEARGDVLCQWDDDDRYHPGRIVRQLSKLQGSGTIAVFLDEVMHLFPQSGRLYLLNWRATPTTVDPSTLMCLRAAEPCYPEAGDEARLGEDRVVLQQLKGLGECRALSGEPHLYVYTAHGANTCSDDHHRMLAERLAVTRGLLLRREAVLRAGLGPFDFGRGGCAVYGSNGPAFSLERFQPDWKDQTVLKTL
jgi:glycosyltransferase involved in cell wall biosynthesis